MFFWEKISIFKNIPIFYRLFLTKFNLFSLKESVEREFQL